MIKSPETAENKDSSGNQVNIQFTIQNKKHEIDEKKLLVKGIRVDYEKKNIVFKKTITFKKEKLNLINIIVNKH